MARYADVPFEPVEDLIDLNQVLLEVFVNGERSRFKSPSKIGDFFAEMAELADARDLKSLGPKARPGSIPGLGTIIEVDLESSGA